MTMRGSRNPWMILLAGVLCNASLGCDAGPAGHPAAYYACEDRAAADSAAHPRAGEFQAFLDDLVTGGYPGAIMLVRTPDQSMWVGASGTADLATGVEMQPCHLSRAASVSKTVIASLVMMEVEAGTLALDDRIADHLPASLTGGVPNADQATVRQLLGHTSGIPDVTREPSWFLGYLNDPTELWDDRAVIEHTRDLDADFAPGEGWSYSNTNYSLLGLMLEELTGRPYAALVHERITDPLGLERSAVDPDTLFPEGIVPGYTDWHGDGLVQDTRDWATGYANAGGALVTTATELATFIEAMAGGEVVSPASLAEMQDWTHIGRDRDDGRNWYGLGLQRWRTDYGDAIGHNGGLVGHHADAFLFPESGATVVLLANGAWGKSDDALREFKERIPSLIHQP